MEICSSLLFFAIFKGKENFSLTHVIENDFKILELEKYNILNLWGYDGATAI